MKEVSTHIRRLCILSKKNILGFQRLVFPNTSKLHHTLRKNTPEGQNDLVLKEDCITYTCGQDSEFGGFIITEINEQLY